MRQEGALNVRLVSAAVSFTTTSGVGIAASLAERATTSRLRRLTLYAWTDWQSDAVLAAFGNALTAQGACTTAREAAGAPPGLSELELVINYTVTLDGFRALARGMEAAGEWVERVGVADYGDPGEGVDPGVKAEGVRLLREAAQSNMAIAPGREAPIVIEELHA